MLVDAFLFFNELELLEIRLAELDSVVDRFLLIEASTTFRGDPKPAVFAEARERFAPYLSKITSVCIDLPENPDPWVRERAQRNAIAQHLALLNLAPKDIVIISDVDEIPDPATLRGIKATGLRPGLHALEQEMYYYRPTLRWNRIWTASRLMTYETLTSSGKTIDELRMEGSYQRIPKGGWHFSYFGGVAAIQTKLNSFSHQEFNTPRFASRENIDRCITQGLDLFHRRDQGWVNVPLAANPYLPDSIRTRFHEG